MLHSRVKDSGHQTEAFDLRDGEGWWVVVGLHQQLHAMTTRHAGVVESTDGVCGRVLALFSSLLLSQARARRERESSIRPRHSTALGGPGTDPITLIGPRWEAWTPCLHGHQCLARSTEAGPQLDRAGAVTCFGLVSLEDPERRHPRVTLDTICADKKKKKTGLSSAKGLLLI